MRQKTYYSNDEITPNLYTFGKEFQYADGTEYKGLYHKYITGEIYTQANWNAQTSKKLVAYKPVVKTVRDYNQLNEQNLKFKTPYSVIPNPTNQDRAAGFMSRYFVKKINDTAIIEIDKKQADDYNQKKIDTKLYLYTTIIWYITGPVEDVLNKNILIEGVVTKNKKQLIQAEQVIPGMIRQYTDLLRYYTDVSYIVPKDING